MRLQHAGGDQAGAGSASIWADVFVVTPSTGASCEAESGFGRSRFSAAFCRLASAVAFAALAIYSQIEL
jgi:hypothetical protein